MVADLYIADQNGDCAIRIDVLKPTEAEDVHELVHQEVIAAGGYTGAKLPSGWQVVLTILPAGTSGPTMKEKQSCAAGGT